MDFRCFQQPVDHFEGWKSKFKEKFLFGKFELRPIRSIWREQQNLTIHIFRKRSFVRPMQFAQTRLPSESSLHDWIQQQLASGQDLWSRKILNRWVLVEWNQRFSEEPYLPTRIFLNGRALSERMPRTLLRKSLRVVWRVCFSMWGRSHC